VISRAPAFEVPQLDLFTRQRLDALLGGPVELETLKHKPGRRLTLAAQGSCRRAVVKVYGSERAAAVAGRVSALAAGPPEPAIPEVLLVDPGLHVVVLSWLPGITLRRALLLDDGEACLHAGAALGGWHRFWCGVDPAPLEAHSLERELEILRVAAARSAWAGASAAVARARPPARPWMPRTVVHRDL
jgi:hypothetical protein